MENLILKVEANSDNSKSYDLQENEHKISKANGDRSPRCDTNA